MILRGLKTLVLRMDRHSTTALKLAHDLKAHPAVAWVSYPGFEDHPQRRLVERQMRAGGGMIALELRRGLSAGRTFLDATRIAIRAVSLGDAETLIQHPASMTHVTYSAEERAQHGFTDGLIRLSVGLEDYVDLREDLLTALDRDRAVNIQSFFSSQESLGTYTRRRGSSSLLSGSSEPDH